MLFEPVPKVRRVKCYPEWLCFYCFLESQRDISLCYEEWCISEWRGRETAKALQMQENKVKKKTTLRGNNKTTELAVFKLPFFFPCSICFIFCGIFPKPISLSRGKSPTCKHFSDLLSWFKKKISLSYMFPLQTEDIGWALLWELNITFVAVALLLSWTVSKICSLIL